MQIEELKSKLIGIIAEEALLDEAEIVELETFDGVIDSLSFIVIVANIEAELGISIPKDQLKSLTSLETTVSLVHDLIQNQELSV